MIRYLPNEILKKIAPGTKIERALKANLSLKKAALVNASQFDFLKKGEIERVALGAMKAYRKSIRDGLMDKAEVFDDPAMLVNRVQNAVVFQVKERIEKKYKGKTYTWLPSDADEPDPEHQLNYGLIFEVGVGEMPGDRYGCRCGLEINVDDSSLDL